MADRDDQIIELVEEAQRRYMQDPEFHARAELAMQSVRISSRVSTGQELSQREGTVALMASILALALAERDPATLEKRGD